MCLFSNNLVSFLYLNMFQAYGKHINLYLFDQIHFCTVRDSNCQSKSRKYKRNLEARHVICDDLSYSTAQVSVNK